MTKNTFQVKTDSFEGPLELLLELIEARKMHPSDVALAAVADEYLLHIKSLEKFPAEEVASFIVVAATLLLIKSRSLLPTLELSDEEEADIATLEMRLALYQKTKECARVLGAQFGKTPLFEREEGTTLPVFAPHTSLSIASLHSAATLLLQTLPPVETLAKAVVQKVVKLEEMIERLIERMTTTAQTSFREFANAGSIQSKEEKVHVIVGFLALLELVKEGLLSVEQRAHFEDIAITKQS